MLTEAQIRYDSQQQAVKSAREKHIPLALWPEDLTVDGWQGVRIPYLSNRRSIRPPLGPPMWKQADVQKFLPDYPYKWFFVDSSGQLTSDGISLTRDEFRKLLAVYQKEARTAGYEVGVGIAEVGQFQVHVASYLRKL